ncbi:putative fungistatic metabolite [Termitomyces sp. T112]|nr:putative fungistatic metabolite [Termitomyces sp. T112]
MKHTIEDLFNRTLQSCYASFSPSVVQELEARSFPPGLFIPSDLTLWGPYSYLGCFTDDTASRSLTVLSSSSNTMTIENCLGFCNSVAGYFNLAYVGLEYASQCYCDWVLQDTAVQVDDSQCNMPCAGNTSQPCGAGNRLTIVSLGGSPTSAPAILNTANDQWNYQGCYHDSQTARILPQKLAVPFPQFFTLEMCAATCGAAGYTYAGVEYRNECWCGSSLPPDATLGPDADCGMACLYDYFERCGAADRISVYKLAA